MADPHAEFNKKMEQIAEEMESSQQLMRALGEELRSYPVRRETGAVAGPSSMNSLQSTTVSDPDQIHPAISSFRKTGCPPMPNAFLRYMRNDVNALTGNIPQLTLKVGWRSPKKAPDPLLRSSLGETHALLYERVSNPGHLEKAFFHTSQALIEADADADENIRHTCTKNWAFVLRLQAQRSGEPGDEAINALKNVLSTAPDDENKTAISIELACSLLHRYSVSNDLQDLQDAILYARCTSVMAIAGMPLSIGHRQRFERHGDIRDLDQAIRYARVTTKVTKQNGGYTFACALHTLSLCLAHRFTVTSAESDLHEAITLCHQAIDTMSGHVLLCRFKTDLARMYLTQYDAGANSHHLSTALHFCKEAVCEGSSRSDICHVDSQSLQGLILATMGGVDGKLDHLIEGISFCRLAGEAELIPEQVRVLFQSRHSQILSILASRTQSTEILDESIRWARLALSSSHEDQTRVQIQLDLGNLLMEKYEKTHESIHLDGSIECFRNVAFASVGDLRVVFAGVVAWVNAASLKDKQTSLEALAATITLLPRIAWIGHDMRKRFQDLALWSPGLACRACAVAIECNDYALALDLLEKGRTILWSQSMQITYSKKYGETATTTDANELKLFADVLSSKVHDEPIPTRCTLVERMFEESVANEKLPGWMAKKNVVDEETPIWMFRSDPDGTGKSTEAKIPSLPVTLLFDDLIKIMQRVSTVVSQRPDSWDVPLFEVQTESNRRREFLEAYTANRRDAASEWKRLWEKLTPIQESLLYPAPRSLHHLCRGASEGVVIVLNADKARCDAIIITCDSPIRLLPLSRLTFHDAVHWAKDLRDANRQFISGSITGSEFERHTLLPILRELWDTVCNPVLTAIETIGPVPRRIWWCPTGPLTFLPIHAAGPYRKHCPGVMDRVISSYTPSVNALLRARESQKFVPFRLLVVSQPNAPDQMPIPLASAEVDTIKSICSKRCDTVTFLEGSQGTVESVTNALKDHSWLHFACHGNQDLNYAFHSSFTLHDGSLYLSRLVGTDVCDSQFAMILACSASAGDETLPDECIHMAAGLQHHGARSLVSTMWPIEDGDAVQVTGEVYKYIFRDSSLAPNCADAAEALHNAVMALKASRVPLHRRVPFIHIGI